MTAPELLPCPFCGGEASHNGGGGSCFGRSWWIVGCKTCDIWVSDPEIWDKKNPGMLDPAYPAKWCIAAWNRRTPSPEVAALIAEARREGWNAAKEAAEKACDPSSYQAHHASVRRRCQTAIRALEEETP